MGKEIFIDKNYLIETLFKLIEIPSPSGYTDQIVHFIGEELTKMNVTFELTRKGAIRATLFGKQHTPDRAIVVHVDTIGAMVKSIKDNTRLGVNPIGSWSPRFAEGARTIIFTDRGVYHGTILPLKASGHAYNTEIDTQPVSWNNLEIRIDEICDTKEEVEKMGINVGDFVAIDPMPVMYPSGYINSRHLDNKAGVAILMTVIKSIIDSGVEMPVDCHPLFTIYEEIGVGASAILFQDVAVMVAIDNSTIAPGQNSSERGVTIALKDSAGPFDYHVTRKLIRLCEDNNILYHRDVFNYYRSDSASALEAGNDIRTALVCFELDGSHGYERTHINSLIAVAKLITLYLQSPPTIMHDKDRMGTLEGFPRQIDYKKCDFLMTCPSPCPKKF